MNDEEKGSSLEPEDIPSNPSVPITIEKPETIEAIEQQVNADGPPSLSVGSAPRTDEVVPPMAVEPVFVKDRKSVV